MADIIFPGQAPIENLGRTRLPGNMDLSIWKGDVQDFVVSLTTSAGAPISLSGKTPTAMIRKDFATASPSYDFTCTVQNGNEVAFHLPSSVTKTMPAGDYIWNFQLTNANGDVRTYLAGDVMVYNEVDNT